MFNFMDEPIYDIYRKLKEEYRNYMKIYLSYIVLI